MKIIAIIMIIATMAVSCSSMEEITSKYPTVNNLENTECKTHKLEIVDFDARESDSDFEHGTIQIWCGDIPMKIICRFTVVGQNPDGTPKMADPKSTPLSELIKFTKGQNPLEAFMSNFIRQAKNPTLFSFFMMRSSSPALQSGWCISRFSVHSW